jgi:hypothetical protein
MGQYYKIVNLTKREFLTPWTFNDGAKLLEFGSSGDGTMTGLAILLASGNGRGGGDLYISKTVNKLGKLKPHQKVFHTYSSTNLKGKKIAKEIRVPTIVGSWAGDQIVIAGDYDDPNLFGIMAGKKPVSYKYGNKRRDTATVQPEHQNLYSLIEIDQHLPKIQRQWRDISKDVIKAMKDDPCLAQAIKDREHPKPTVKVELTDEEMQALRELSRFQELPLEKVMIQALRAYQAQVHEARFGKPNLRKRKAK